MSTKDTNLIAKADVDELTDKLDGHHLINETEFVVDLILACPDDEWVKILNKHEPDWEKEADRLRELLLHCITKSKENNDG